MEIFQELQNSKERVKNNIVKGITNIQEALSKGGDLMYDNIIPKSGAALKSGVEKQIMKIHIMNKEIDSLLNNLLSVINEVPSEPMCVEDSCQELMNQFTSLPALKFPYSSLNSEIKNPAYSAEYRDIDVNENKLKETYNSKFRELQDNCEKLSVLNTMFNNLEDDKTYFLSIKDLNRLGF